MTLTRGCITLCSCCTDFLLVTEALETRDILSSVAIRSFNTSVSKTIFWLEVAKFSPNIVAGHLVLSVLHVAYTSLQAPLNQMNQDLDI
jgi:hypothetical protein